MIFVYISTGRRMCQLGKGKYLTADRRFFMREVFYWRKVFML
ncbi:hypothetical protein HMPREF1548_06769 [Clostridium sp. KLE 1755]|nr:hypothetical protein HMPREF1548_06769 [Clostridium sp. KLE 1755]